MLFRYEFVFCFAFYFIHRLVRAEIAEDQFEKILEDLHSEQLARLDSMEITRTQPCLQLTARNTTVPRAIGRNAKDVVDVDPSMHFDFVFCSAKGPRRVNSCAVDSACTTIYRWRKARTRVPIPRSREFVDDYILVPTSCMCVLGEKNTDDRVVNSTPIIVI